MSAPYSYDLRKKAIEAVKRGERKTDVCRFLKISRNTLDLWLKREKSTGDCQASANSAKGRKPKIQDPEKFREFVREHSDKTQKQIAQLWGEELTQQNISYACQKLGITRKKKLTVIKKEMKKNEQNLEKN
jgi:transposase